MFYPTLYLSDTLYLPRLLLLSLLFSVFIFYLYLHTSTFSLYFFQKPSNSVRNLSFLYCYFFGYIQSPVLSASLSSYIPFMTLRMFLHLLCLCFCTSTGPASTLPIYYLVLFKTLHTYKHVPFSFVSFLPLPTYIHYICLCFCTSTLLASRYLSACSFLNSSWLLTFYLSFHFYPYLPISTMFLFLCIHWSCIYVPIY